MSRKRTKIPNDIKVTVLTEAGYRCAVPTCRNILAIDLHHIVEVSEGGENDVANLIALCSFCHDLFHRGVISRESIYNWKGVLIALSLAFDVETVDKLLFLSKLKPNELRMSGDGVLQFVRLIAAGLAEFKFVANTGSVQLYEVHTTLKGKLLTDAWKVGDRAAVATALAADTDESQHPV